MPTEEQLQEIHRLAVLGEAIEIAQEVGPRLTGFWLATSRFREACEVSLQTLALGPHARTLNDLASAKRVLGERQEALKHYATDLKALSGGWRPGGPGYHPEQHRRGLRRPRRSRASAELLPARPAHPGRSGQPVRTGRCPEQHRRGLPWPRGWRASAELLPASPAYNRSGGRPGGPGRRPEQHRLGLPWPRESRASAELLPARPAYPGRGRQPVRTGRRPEQHRRGFTVA